MFQNSVKKKKKKKIVILGMHIYLSFAWLLLTMKHRLRVNSTMMQFIISQLCLFKM